MFFFLSKFLPNFIFPLGLACVLLVLALWVHRRPRWQTGFIALALALLWLGSNRIVNMVLLRSLEWQYLPSTTSQSSGLQADVIVVLGGGERSKAFPRPTSELNEAGDRLLYAAQLYRQGAAPHILVSGGNAPWVSSSSVPGAESMAEILRVMGVPDEALWLEPASRNTYENALETKAILESRGIESVLLVTSAMHMPRAYAVFAKTGLQVAPAPTDFLVTQEDWEYYTQPDVLIQLFNLLPTANSLAVTTRVLKEYVGIVVYRLRGWL
jgi:uncharacterized SAM-binding protein YcdF (DUF218 family)